MLIALGLLLAAFPFVTASWEIVDLSLLRFPGVLQRIALCYFAVTLLLLFTSSRVQIGVGVALRRLRPQTRTARATHAEASESSLEIQVHRRVSALCEI